jgi:hypothetical protein
VRFQNIDDRLHLMDKPPLSPDKPLHDANVRDTGLLIDALQGLSAAHKRGPSYSAMRPATVKKGDR